MRLHSAILTTFKTLSALVVTAAILSADTFAANTDYADYTPKLLPNDALSSLNLDLKQSSVSGLSSGGYMATQFHLSHSDIIVGAGIVGAGPYYCALNDIAIALGQCVNKISNSITNEPFIEAYERFLQDGLLASKESLTDDKVILIHGKHDTTVNRKAADLLARQYEQWLGETNFRYISDKDFAHHMPTLNYGTDCKSSESPFIGNCDYDAAGEILNFIYDGLKTPVDDKANQSLFTLDVTELSDLSGSSIADKAYIYIPETCQKGQSCKLHVSFHGCNQSAEDVGSTYAAHAGFNRWAQSNDIVVLYPQVEKSMFMPLNPQGCWDWWGYTDENYANQKGPQIQAIRNIVNALASSKSD
uniref:extracellular catalytic domain type 2 short-chain-length polyhydroxyalkanoate depolymerase n=1 Tax=Ningiella ruwaisensis TaxID=2364274 RepID=UPI001445390A|nr:PHB depolymerase family esterase [Ningiella ruwaisensis]